MKFLFIERKYNPRLIKNAFNLASVGGDRTTITQQEYQWHFLELGL